MKAVCPSHLFAQKLKYILISSIAQGIESLNVSYYYWLEPGQTRTLASSDLGFWWCDGRVLRKHLNSPLGPENKTFESTCSLLLLSALQSKWPNLLNSLFFTTYYY